MKTTPLQIDTHARRRCTEAIFQHAREGILVTGPDGTIIDVNDAFTRVTGYAREEAIGRNPSLLQSRRQPAAFYTVLWETLQREGYWQGEIWNRRKDGEVYAELLTITAVRDDAGTLEYYVGLYTDISAQKNPLRGLEQLTYYDVLTGLPNRRLLVERLRQSPAQARRHRTTFAVVYINLDGFKDANARLGHAGGDDLLVTIATRMRQSLRETDTLARVGGDEFVTVLQDLDDTRDCIPLLARIKEACTYGVLTNETSLTISASIGIAFFPADGRIDGDSMLQWAEWAMQQAKRAGKNRYHIFDNCLDMALFTQGQRQQAAAQAAQPIAALS